MSNVTIVRTMRATIQFETRNIEASHDGSSLTFEKIDAALAEAILQHVGKLKLPGAAVAPKAAPKAKVENPHALPVKQVMPLVTPSPQADPPAEASPSPLQGTTPVKAPAKPKAGDPLPTPDELRAAREKKEAAAKKPEPAKTKAAAEDEAEEDDRAPLPDGVKEETTKPGKKPFVEDLDVHQAADAGVRAAAGEGEIPEALSKAKNLKEIIAWFWDNHNLHTAGELVEACEGWRTSLPVIGRIDKKSLKSRIENQLEVHDFNVAVS